MQYEIDYTHWATMKTWGTRQAACLLLNINPEQYEDDCLNCSKNKWKLLTDEQKFEINQRQELIAKKGEQVSGWFRYEETYPFRYVDEELNNPTSYQHWETTCAGLFKAIAEQFLFTYDAFQTYSQKQKYIELFPNLARKLITPTIMAHSPIQNYLPWCHREFWTAREAFCLLSGLEPESYALPSSAAHEFKDPHSKHLPFAVLHQYEIASEKKLENLLWWSNTIPKNKNLHALLFKPLFPNTAHFYLTHKLNKVDTIKHHPYFYVNKALENPALWQLPETFLNVIKARFLADIKNYPKNKAEHINTYPLLAREAGMLAAETPQSTFDDEMIEKPLGSKERSTLFKMIGLLSKHCMKRSTTDLSVNALVNLVLPLISDHNGRSPSGLSEKNLRDIIGEALTMIEPLLSEKQKTPLKL